METNNTQLTVKKTDLFKVPFSNLQIVDGLNIRKDLGDLESLAASIKENGVKVPFRGWREGETYFIVDGHRRYAACALLVESGADLAVPFIVEPKGSNAESRIVDMFITNEGKQLTPLEQAEGINRLIKYGWEQKDIAAKLGKSQSYISKLATLATAPVKLVKLIEKGKVSATLAMDMLVNDSADKFLADYEAGKFSKEIEPQANGKEKKITSAQVKAKTSWQIFKEYAATAPTHTMTEDKKRVFGMMCKVMNNEYSEQDFINYFER